MSLSLSVFPSAIFSLYFCSVSESAFLLILSIPALDATVRSKDCYIIFFSTLVPFRWSKWCNGEILINKETLMFKKKLVRQIHHNPDCSIFSKLPSIYVILGKCRVWYLFGSQLSHLFVSASHYLEKQPTLLKYPFKWGYLQTYRKRPPVGRKRLPDVRQRSPRSPTRL